jgi:peptidoglycan/xylan/chitin deacetylase (PgdA/CDA1 family)
MVTRKSLPKNFILKKGTVWEDFETITNQWYKSGNGTVTGNTDIFKTGSQSMQLTAVDSGGVAGVKTINMNMKTDDKNKKMNIRAYIPDPTTVASIYISLSSQANFASNFNYYFSTISLKDRKPGWYDIQINKPDWNVVGGESWDNTMLKMMIKLFPQTGKTATVYIDSVRRGVKSVPMWLPTFDDSHISLYNAYELMNEKKIKGTFFINSNTVDSDANHLTLTHLQEMYASGNCLSNHTDNHADLSTLTSIQANMDRIKPTIDYLLQHGFTRGAYFFAYPFHKYSTAYTFSALDKLGVKATRDGAVGNGFIYNLAHQAEGNRNFKLIPCQGVSNNTRIQL